MQRMPEINAMVSIRRSYRASFSPDGKTLAFISDRSGVPQVWTVGADGSALKAVTTFEDPVRVVLWSPDGAWLAALVAPGGGMNRQIWFMHPDGSGAKRITAGGKDNNFIGVFSHDGKKLGYSANTRDPASADPYLYDIASGTSTRVAEVQGFGFVQDISRDGKQVLLFHSRTRGDADFLVHDIAAGTDILLTPHQGPAYLDAGAFSADGKYVYFAGDLRRDRVALFRAALRGKGAGAPELLAARDDADLFDVIFDERFTTGVLSWNASGRSELAWYDPKRNLATGIAEPPAEILYGAGLSRDGKRLTLTGEGAVQPTNVFVADLPPPAGARKARVHFVPITDSPHEGVELSKLVRPELVRYSAKDGLPLTGWLYRPAGASGPGPIVLSFHGGPEGQERPYFSATYQALLAHGIAVLAPNVRGSSGFGKRFVNLDNGALRKGGPSRTSPPPSTGRCRAGSRIPSGWASTAARTVGIW
ncbi:hypothetical protein [Pendulispora albinea]|uniref:Peptidase S9 prolyl oligopeptidase catalytic domain-containing protein n=1 Tax=Pendulispora albinea TaxID=2741071 RepID=A0ABZ2LLI8_9BACT